jgi:hypothetical protein
MHAQWLNFLYHYGVGGMIFLLGVGAMVKAGTLRWERPSDRLLLKGLVGGLLTFASVHALWIAAASSS